MASKRSNQLNEAAKRYNKRLRLAVIAFLGGMCVRCQADDWRVLQVDHINGGGSQESRLIGSGGVYRRALSGAPGYQLLCANCNWVKRYENGETV